MATVIGSSWSVISMRITWSLAILTSTSKSLEAGALNSVYSLSSYSVVWIGIGITGTASMGAMSADVFLPLRGRDPFLDMCLGLPRLPNLRACLVGEPAVLAKPPYGLESLFVSLILTCCGLDSKEKGCTLVKPSAVKHSAVNFGLPNIWLLCCREDFSC